MNILIIIIVVCVIFIILSTYTNMFYSLKEIGVLNTISKLKKCNLKFIDITNNEVLLEVKDTNIDQIKVYIRDKNKFIESIYKDQELGLGETYMKGIWFSNNLPGFLTILAINSRLNNVSETTTYNIYSKNINQDKENIKHHYDVGNDFYNTFLTDKLSAYSCGFWESENDTLDDAQYRKVNTIIMKMDIKPGSKILDIGCGWGKIANYIARQSKSHVTGITVSDKQVEFAQNNFDPKLVNVISIDYRKLNNIIFDYIYSIGMFEHVRYENYDDFFSTINRCLSPEGRFVLHTIVCNDNKEPDSNTKAFVTTHIFPGGQIPKNDWIVHKAEANGLRIVHTEFFGGQHYAQTLRTWCKNMLKQKDYILKNYGKELLLKYEYYFTICEAGFNSNIMGIGHYVIIKGNTVNLSNSFIY